MKWETIMGLWAHVHALTAEASFVCEEPCWKLYSAEKFKFSIKCIWPYKATYTSMDRGPRGAPPHGHAAARSQLTWSTTTRICPHHVHTQLPSQRIAPRTSRVRLPVSQINNPANSKWCMRIPRSLKSQLQRLCISADPVWLRTCRASN